MDRITPDQLGKPSGSLEVHELAIERNTSLENVCRICFDGESASKRLISPCKCSGSVRYIHEECLKTWILSQTEDLSQARCELCLHEFHMHYKMRMKLDINKICKEGKTQCFFAPFLLLILFSICVIMYLIVIRFTKEISAKEIVYDIIVLLSCIVATSIIFWIIAKSIRNYFCIRNITGWIIEAWMPNYVSGEEESTENILVKIEDTFLDERNHGERIEHFEQTIPTYGNSGTIQRLYSSSAHGRGTSVDTPIFRRRNPISLAN